VIDGSKAPAPNRFAVSFFSYPHQTAFGRIGDHRIKEFLNRIIFSYVVPILFRFACNLLFIASCLFSPSCPISTCIRGLSLDPRSTIVYTVSMAGG
jgi:hypothetical protein